MQPKFIAMIACLVLGCLPVQAAAPKGISLEALPAGDTLTITYSSSGCFYSAAYDFEFQRAAVTTVEIFKLEPQRDPANNAELAPKRVSLGVVTLTEKEAAGIDRLLTYYRSKPPGGCTTIDNILVVQRNGQTVKTSEAFVDASCQAADQANVTLLPSLVEKLPKDR